MKKVTTSICSIAMLVFAYSCNSEQSTETTTDTTLSKTENVLDAVGDKVSGVLDRDSLSDDKEFVMEAASDGMMEVELGKFASANAINAQGK